VEGDDPNARVASHVRGDVVALVAERVGVDEAADNNRPAAVSAPKAFIAACSIEGVRQCGMFIALLFIISALGGPTVAIADLVNLTGDASLDGAGPGVAGILVSRFQQTESVTVIERGALASLLVEQRLTVAGLTQPATAARAGRLLGAEYLVVGELIAAKLPTLSIALRVVDTETGEVVVSRDVVGEIGERGERFFLLIDQLSDDILEAMKVDLSDAERRRLSEIDQREMDAVLRYGEGLIRVNLDHPMALYRQSDHDFSRDHYHRTRWMVFETGGERVGMPVFARRVGDQATYLQWAEQQRRNRRKTVRTNILTGAYGVLGGVFMVAGGRVGDGDGDPETASTLQMVGVGMFTVAPAHAVINLFRHSLRRRGTDYPGVFYTPDEADRWINTYNRGLE
jgi:TolB-like protein